jgi:ribonucleoside-triphosphate reductase (thioredoxin)
MRKMHLSDTFLEQYIGKNPKWGLEGLGYMVYLRTYSRKKADGTQEAWWETVKRVTEGNFALEEKRLKEIGKWDYQKEANLREEMERFYHLMFNLVLTPPGRGLWMSGTAYAEKIGDAENNCWFISMRPQKYGESKIQPAIGSIDEFLPSMPAVFTFDQAMKGGGVGVNLQRKNTDLMPNVKNEISLYFISDPTHDDYLNELNPLGVAPVVAKDDTSVYRVKDSREGWAEALQLVIDSHFIEENKHLVLDISQVRPRGSEIRGFGGVASGPAPLVQMLSKVNEILNKRVGEQVTSVEWGDIIQNIGCCVVAGNVRRTALILIGDNEDKDFIESKNYSLEKNQEASQWRWASNNSVAIDEAVTPMNLEEMAKNIYFNGEPGIVNIELSKHHGRIADGLQENIDGEVEGFNPCGEITLPNASPCNLFEINLPKIHELIDSGREDSNLYNEASWLAARYAYRITFRNYEWEVTRKIIEKHRRLGVGITGIADWVLMKFGDRAVLGFDEQNKPIFNRDVEIALDRLYQAVKETNRTHADKLEAQPSIKLTTVKPSGSMSLLMGVSPGMHWHWSKYMIRRVRFSANSALIPALIECGYYVEPVISGFQKDGSPKIDQHTLVVEFPTKAPTAEHPKFQAENDVPLAEQAAVQALLQSYWSDNAVSATLTFNKEEGKEENSIAQIAAVLEQSKQTLKSTSLLPHDSNTYPQMPLEAITKEEYEKKKAKITAKPWELLGEVRIEEDDDADVIGECKGGVCPIR